MRDGGSTLLTADAIAGHADAIRHWLLGDAPQIAGGRHDGGVLGWVSGRDAFVYPEIMGYYLTALMFIARTEPACASQCADRAARALDWLHRRDAWTTRDYLHGHGDDWRNRVTFTFDTGIVLRGVTSWTAASRTRRLAARVRTACLDTLSRVPPAAGGRLGSHRGASAGRGGVPRRWSTQSGPHLVKAAAAIGELPMSIRPAAVSRRAERTVRHWRARISTGRLTAESHPLFYCLEGLLLDAMARRRQPAWAAIGNVLLAMSPPGEDGDYPERLTRPYGPRRGDVTAQALRLACLVPDTGERDRLMALRAARDRACGALIRKYVDDDGAVHVFPVRGADRRRENNPPNVWAAIFAYQALRFYGSVLRGRRIPPRLVRLLA